MLRSLHYIIVGGFFFPLSLFFVIIHSKSLMLSRIWWLWNVICHETMLCSLELNSRLIFFLYFFFLPSVNPYKLIALFSRFYFFSLMQLGIFQINEFKWILVDKCSTIPHFPQFFYLMRFLTEHKLRESKGKK